MELSQCEDHTRKSLFRRIVTHPLFGTIGWLMTAVGTVFGIYAYYSQRKVHDLTYYVHPVKTTVVKVGQASRLKVQLDGTEIQSDVTAIKIALWNRGSLSIRPADILKPVSIAIPDSRILEASIQKQSRDVINMRLDTTSSSNTLCVTWDILEKDDGGILQVIYAGADSVPVELNGVIEGQRDLSLVKYPGKVRSSEEQVHERSELFVLGWTQIGVALFGLLVNVIEYLVLYSRFKRGGQKPKVAWDLLGLFLAMFTIGCFLLSLVPESGPPFGFI